MPCDNITIPDAIICSGRGRRRKRCEFCPASGTRLCDFPAAGGRTCDAPLCDLHAVTVAPNIDYCQVHGRREVVR